MSGISYRGHFTFILGNRDTTIYFWVELQFPPKWKNLERWRLMAIFCHPEGCSGFVGMLQGQATHIPQPPLSHQPNHLPALATSPQNLNHPSEWQKLPLIASFQGFFILGEITGWLKNKSSHLCFPKRMQIGHGTKSRSFHFTLGRVNFTSGGKNIPH